MKHRTSAVSAAGSHPELPGPAAAWRRAVRGEADVGPVVASATQFCAGQGLSPLLAAHVATAVSELANNLWMHADAGGSLSLSVLRRAGAIGVELVAEDAGPGIADIAQALQEGYSTAGSLGCGLPAVRRLMDDFAITSTAGTGTRVVACKWQPLPT